MTNPPDDSLQLSEDVLALDFAECHPDYRWVQTWGKWLCWDGQVWNEDSTLHTFEAVRNFLRSSSWMHDRPNVLGRAATVAAVEKLAKCDRRFAAKTDQWDQDPMVLNTQNGVVDLTTLQHREATPDQHLTKITGFGVDDAECPRWLAFLEDITDSDNEMTAFLQRVTGYCLTGDTKEHALFFLHGSGANGKSTFLNVLAQVFGDYATDAPMETFTVSNSDRHPTELAMLRGARLVTAVETEEGRRWAESRIKQMTGGDRITARFMRQDFFTFRPQFKLLIAGNHRPRLHAVDEAMRRRFHLIPFETRFRGDKCIKDMETQLLEEGAGILGWAIEGCSKWQVSGLSPPERVRSATEHYFANQDVLGEWLAERCETGPDYWETPTRLFSSWKAFAKDGEFAVGTRSSFNDRMESAGYCQLRDRSRRYWAGIKLRPGAETKYQDRCEAGA